MASIVTSVLIAVKNIDIIPVTNILDGISDCQSYVEVKWNHFKHRFQAAFIPSNKDNIPSTKDNSKK